MGRGTSSLSLFLFRPFDVLSARPSLDSWRLLKVTLSSYASRPMYTMYTTGKRCWNDWPDLEQEKVVVGCVYGRSSSR